MAIDSNLVIDSKSNGLTSRVIMGKSASDLSMDDFFSLLVAQMTNQDMMNPTSDTEFVAQMAQFASLQGVQTITEYQLSSYAASYIGKTVSIAHTTDSGELKKVEGTVDRVTYYDGEPKVVVGGVSYPLYSVMEIRAAGTTPTPPADDDTDKTEEQKGQEG